MNNRIGVKQLLITKIREESSRFNGRRTIEDCRPLMNALMGTITKFVPAHARHQFLEVVFGREFTSIKETTRGEAVALLTMCYQGRLWSRDGIDENMFDWLQGIASRLEGASRD